MLQKSFLFNNVRVKLVPYHGQDTCPETGIAFYVNNGNGGVIGVRVYPDGRKVLVNPDRVKLKHAEYSHGKAEYQQFRDAWGPHLYILVSHAIYIAWRDKPIPPGMTIDHINGCTTNNDVRNLRCVSNLVNNRDGGFLHKLQHKGIDTTTIQRAYLLRYFDRMVKFKASHTATEYRNLTKDQLIHILYDAEFSVNFG